MIVCIILCLHTSLKPSARVIAYDQLGTVIWLYGITMQVHVPIALPFGMIYYIYMVDEATLNHLSVFYMNSATHA